MKKIKFLEIITIMTLLVILLQCTEKFNAWPKPAPFLMEWIEYYPHTSAGNAIAINGAYIYIAGINYSNNDILLLKYDIYGNLIWDVSWGGEDVDEALGVAVNEGYIYVVGYTESYGEGGRDLVLLKFNESGNLIWSVTWGGADDEEGRDLAVDESGIYVTGYTKSFSNKGILIMKFNENGEVVWNTTRADASMSGEGIVLDEDYVYVCGANLILKYSKSDGSKIWETSLSGASLYDIAAPSAEGYDDTIVVTGRIETSHGNDNIFTGMYTKDGNEVWSSSWGRGEYASSDTTDLGQGICCRGSYIYVIGVSNSYKPGSYDYDLVLLVYDMLGHLCTNRTWGHACNFVDWGNDLVCSGNSVYATGWGHTYAEGSSTSGAFLAKFKEPVSVAWYRYEDGVNKGYDATCSNGYIYITGCSSDPITCWDIPILKYDSDGNIIWNTTYASGADDFGRGIAVNSSYIYVAGYTGAEGSQVFDILLLKYVDEGSMVWYKTLDFNDSDCLLDIAINGSYIFTTGFSSDNDLYTCNLLVCKFNADGGLEWAVFHHNVFGFIRGSKIVVNGSYIYVTGELGDAVSGKIRAFLAKLNSTGGIIWEKFWGISEEDRGTSLLVKGDYIYVTGYSYDGGNYDLRMLKFDADGNLLLNITWGDDSVDETARDIFLSTDGYLYIAGSSSDTYSTDILLLKCSLDFNIVYAYRWGNSSMDEYGRAVCIPVEDKIAIVGWEEVAGAYEKDILLLLFEYPEHLNHTYYGFVSDGYLNATAIVGTSEPHGPCGAANAIDTVGGLEAISGYSMYGSVRRTYYYLDSDV
ncbi:MAG: hypothetical protein DRJ32_05425, partial [Thermoprotei archaeon]